MANGLKLIFLHKTRQNILQYLGTAQISRNVQNKIHNLQIRLDQFTDETKKLKNINQSELHFPQMKILKALKHKYFQSLGPCQICLQVCCVIYRPNSSNLLDCKNS